MVILIRQNKISDFLMILAWASPFNPQYTTLDATSCVCCVGLGPNLYKRKTGKYVLKHALWPDPASTKRWPNAVLMLGTVCDLGPTLGQNWVSVPCLLGYLVLIIMPHNMPQIIASSVVCDVQHWTSISVTVSITCSLIVCASSHVC